MNRLARRKKIPFIENSTMTNGFETILLLKDHTTPQELLCSFLSRMQQQKRRSLATKTQIKSRYLIYCMHFSFSLIFDDNNKQEGQKKLLLLVYFVYVQTYTGSTFLSKEVRMMPLEPNQLSIQHDVVFAEFRGNAYSTNGNGTNKALRPIRISSDVIWGGGSRSQQDE